jgi:hypothetical protein
VIKSLIWALSGLFLAQILIFSHLLSPALRLLQEWLKVLISFLVICSTRVFLWIYSRNKTCATLNYMDKEVFSSERYFTMFDFLISHGQLLLRASKDEDYNINIDIIFYDVKFIQLCTSLPGLSIKLISNNKGLINEYVKSIISNNDNYIYEVRAKGEKYYVTASFVRVFENDLEFNETSLGVFQNRGCEKEIAGTYFGEN